MERTTLTVSPSRAPVLFLGVAHCRVTLSPAVSHPKSSRGHLRFKADAEAAALYRLRRGQVAVQSPSDSGLIHTTGAGGNSLGLRPSFMGKVGRSMLISKRSVSPAKPKPQRAAAPNRGRPAVKPAHQVTTVTLGDELPLEAANTEVGKLEAKYRGWLAAHTDRTERQKKVRESEQSLVQQCETAQADFEKETERVPAQTSRELSPSALARFLQPIESAGVTVDTSRLPRVYSLPGKSLLASCTSSPSRRVARKLHKRSDSGDKSAPRSSRVSTYDLLSEVDFPVIPCNSVARDYSQKKHSRRPLLMPKSLPLYRIPVDFHLFRNVCKLRDKEVKTRLEMTKRG